MSNVAYETHVVRRVYAVMDRSYFFDFFGRHELSPGTEFLVGGPDCPTRLDDAWNLIFQVAPEYVQLIPSEYFHLETEVETRLVRVTRERHPTRMV